VNASREAVNEHRRTIANANSQPAKACHSQVPLPFVLFSSRLISVFRSVVIGIAMLQFYYSNLVMIQHLINFAILSSVCIFQNKI
jgi:hypothetical protein